MAIDPLAKQKIESFVPKDILDSLLKTIDDIPDHVARVKRDRIAQIVQTNIDELKRFARIDPSREGVFRQSLGQKISALAGSAKNPQELRRGLRLLLREQMLEAAGERAKSVPKEFRRAIETMVEKTVNSAESALPVLVAETPSATTIAAELVNSRVQQKEFWLQTLGAQAQKTGIVDFPTTNRLSLAAEAVVATPQGENLTKPFVLFQTGAKGWKKPIAIVVDAALTVFPKTYRDDLIDSIFKKGLEVQTEVGKRIVESPLFEGAIKKGNNVFAAATKPAQGIGNVARSFAGFFEPPPSIEDVLVLVELGIIKAEQVPDYQHVYLASAHAHSPGLFSLFFSEAAGWGIRKGARELAKKGGWKIGAGLGAKLGSFFGGIFGAIVGALAGSGLGSLFGRRGETATGDLLPTGSGVAWFVAFVFIGIASLALILDTTYRGAFQESAREAAPEPGSPYITLTKTPSAGTLQNGEKQTIQYSITVTAKDKALKDIQIIDSSTIYPGGKTSQAYSSGEPDLGPGESHSKTYSVSISGVRDAVVVNTLTVTAQTDTTKPGEKEEKVTSSSVIVGSPKIDVAIQGPAGVSPAGWCNKDGPSVAWRPDEWAKIMGAFASYPAPYMALVKQSNPSGINIYRIHWRGNARTGIFWGCTDETNGQFNIYIYDDGVPNATYILAHELGHRIADNNGWFSLFKRMAAPEGATVYASGYKGEQRLDEDFAETMAQYMSYPESLKRTLPRHYAFARCVFGGIPASQCQ